MAQGIQEQVRILPAIEAESHFVQIGREMLCRDSMPCSDDAALKERERGFDSVGMNVSVNIDFRLVFDGLVLIGEGGAPERSRISIEFIGHDEVNIFAHGLADILRQRPGFNVLRVEESKIAAALSNAYNDLFFRVSESRLAVAFLASTNIGFVYFDRAVHHGTLNFFHGRSDAMAEIPRGLVTDSECAFDLIRRHALACFTEKQGSEKPLLQREMRVVEDCARRHTELIVARFAVKELLRRCEFNYCAVAAETFNSIRPAEAHKQFAAFVVGIEQVYNVN